MPLRLLSAPNNLQSPSLFFIFSKSLWLPRLFFRFLLAPLRLPLSLLLLFMFSHLLLKFIFRKVAGFIFYSGFYPFPFICYFFPPAFFSLFWPSHFFLVSIFIFSSYFFDLLYSLVILFISILVTVISFLLFKINFFLLSLLLPLKVVFFFFFYF